MQNAITFLDHNGDTTIVWDSDTEDQIIRLIEGKMKEGYVFYIVKRVPLLNISRKAKTTSTREMRKAGSVVIKDAELEALFSNGHISMTKRATESIETVKRASTAHEVARSQTVGVRPQRGG